MPHSIILPNANKTVGCGIFGRFSNLDKCRPEVAGTVLDYVGADMCASFGDHWLGLNSCQIMRLFVRLDPF